MYHNIVPNNAPAGHNYQDITLTEKTFNWQMKMISCFFNVISVHDYVKNHNLGRKMPINTIAITIDDGTWHTYDIGSRIWKKFKLPVTIFVNTCQLNDGPLIWGGYLNALCFESLFEKIEINGSIYPLKTTYDKYKTKQLIHKLSLNYGNQHLFFLNLQERYPLTKRIFNYYKGMSYDQLKESSKDYLVTIGAHTHPSLNCLDYDRQKNEIERSQNILENVISHKVDSFAYPSGIYDHNSIKILQELEFKIGCAVAPINIKEAKNNYEIPRIGIYRKDKFGFIVKLVLGLVKLQ
jgi:peptidoglycan/xylan/chitin deacetylase (PgdA/CDA1 family)